MAKTTQQVVTEQPQPQQQIIINQVTPPSNGVGTAGFILSLIGLILSWAPVAGWIIWFLGFLLSFIGMFKRPRGLAITGFLLSLIDLILLVLFATVLAGVFAALLSD